MKKYLEQILKGIVTGISIFIGLSLGILSIYAFNWSGVSTVTSSTTLTAGIWNTTMSTITGAIQTLETGNITIGGTKTFSSPIVGSIIGNAATATTLATARTINGVSFNGSADITLPATGVPTGAIMSFYLANCPTGWIIANGASGTPDLRGAFVRGMYGDQNGRDVARALGDYQDDEFESHLHSIDPPATSTSTNGSHTHTFGIRQYDGPADQGIPRSNYAGNPTTSTTNSSGDHTHTFDISAFNSSTAGSTENRPKNVALIYCMKQ